VAAIPDIDLHKIRKYAAERVPAELHNKIRMEVDVRGKSVTIVECRPPRSKAIGPEWTRHGVAKMKFDPDSAKWTLYWPDRNARWHVCDFTEPGTIEEMLNEIELDQTGIFWG